MHACIDSKIRCSSAKNSIFKRKINILMACQKIINEQVCFEEFMALKIILLLLFIIKSVQLINFDSIIIISNTFLSQKKDEFLNSFRYI